MEVYDLLESAAGTLSGQVVGDGGTGTGIVARQLLERGAHVVAFDPGLGMLRRASLRTSGLPLVAADAAAAPFRAASMHVLCFGQSWHWVEQLSGAREAARMVRPNGWWAAWWNHPWADSEPWFDRYYAVLEERCDVSRQQRDTDWCSDAIRMNADFRTPERHIVTWERKVPIDDWLTDLQSHSYVIALSPTERNRLLQDVEAMLREQFADLMTVPYQTRVWLAHRR
jgi:SAM-dependent methyltransferase